MGASVARMQQGSTKSAKTKYIPFHFTDACVLVPAKLGSLGGSVSTVFGD